MIVYPLLASGRALAEGRARASSTQPPSCPLASARPQADPQGAGISAVGPQPFLSLPKPSPEGESSGGPHPGLCRGPHRNTGAFRRAAGKTVPSSGAKGHFQVWWSLGPECCAPRTRTWHARLRGSGPPGVPPPGPVV